MKVQKVLSVKPDGDLTYHVVKPIKARKVKIDVKSLLNLPKGNYVTPKDIIGRVIIKRCFARDRELNKEIKYRELMDYLRNYKYLINAITMEVERVQNF